MKEISISRKTISAVVCILIIGVLLIAAALILRSHPELLSSIVKTPIREAASEGLEAAITGVQAIYTLDYTESSEQYQKRVCQVTTADGCELIQKMFLPIIQMVVEYQRIQTGSTIIPIRLVQEENKSQVWLLEMTLDHPWQGIENPSQVYAEVVQVNGDWQFNRILLEQEIGRYQTPTP